jgi:ABC-type multidrug transport system permease subunit
MRAQRFELTLRLLQVMLISFACFTKIMGKELTVPVAFTSLALFALVVSVLLVFFSAINPYSSHIFQRGPMNMLPASITQLLQSALASPLSTPLN